MNENGIFVHGRGSGGHPVNENGIFVYGRGSGGHPVNENAEFVHERWSRMAGVARHCDWAGHTSEG